MLVFNGTRPTAGGRRERTGWSTDETMDDTLREIAEALPERG
jgi:hypothetical protein